jgi:DNA-directed RNA polymerase beta' subunit
MKSNEEILELEKTLSKLENLHASFDYLRITIASPKRIKSWAERKLPTGEIVGEVFRPETINFRTHQPEMYGLFCEKIFGPTKNWKCKCGKYNGFVVDKICDVCHVEIVESRVRRYRMGYIDLACPVTHFWYLKGVPNYLCLLLKGITENLKVEHLQSIVYFTLGEEIIEKNNPLYDFRNQSSTKFNKYLSNHLQFESSRPSWGPRPKKLQKRRGAEIIKAAFESIDIQGLIAHSRSLMFLLSPSLLIN